MSPCRYEVMRSCWDADPGARPTFSQLLQTLRGLLAQLPELEPSLEVHYINQVLEVSAASPSPASQASSEPGGDRCENTYLPSPVGAPADPAEVDLDLDHSHLRSSRKTGNCPG